MIRLLGWIFAGIGAYIGVSAYLAGNFWVAALGFLASVLITITNTYTNRGFSYIAILCINDEGVIHQFPLGVATSLKMAAALIKLEAMARFTKEENDDFFSTDFDSYKVQMREMNSASILREFNFSRRGEYVSYTG